MSVSSVPSRIPSPSSFASSPITPSTVLTRDSYPHPPNLFSFSQERFQPRPSYPRHSQYYFSDGNIIFLVDGTIYNIHRYFFQRDSSNFASMFATIPHGGCGKGLTDDEPIALSRVSAKDFDLFLSILYPSDFCVHAATTVAEWTAILDLAANWNFKSIKALAIKNLTPIASPIDKIVLGRKHGIEEWLGDAYEAVCVRDEPLTLEDGMRLGMEDVIKISATRQCIHREPACLPSTLSNSIREVFGPELLHVQEVIHIDQGRRKESISAPETISLSRQSSTIPLANSDCDDYYVARECQAPPKLTKAQKKKKEKVEREARRELERLQSLQEEEMLAALEGL